MTHRGFELNFSGAVALFLYTTYSSIPIVNVNTTIHSEISQPLSWSPRSKHPTAVANFENAEITWHNIPRTTARFCAVNAYVRAFLVMGLLSLDITVLQYVQQERDLKLGLVDDKRGDVEICDVGIKVFRSGFPTRRYP
jgi:hypothetical protein